MSTSDLKEKLRKKISEIEDENLLQEIYNMVCEPVTPYKLTDAQKASILRGREDIKAGRVLSDEEAQKEIDEWLKEED